MIRARRREQEGSASPVGHSPQRYLPTGHATVAVPSSTVARTGPTSTLSASALLQSNYLYSAHSNLRATCLFARRFTSIRTRHRTGGYSRYRWCRQFMLLVLHRYTYLRDHVVLLFHSPPRALDPMRR